MEVAWFLTLSPWLGKVTPYRTGWEWGAEEQVWRRVENLSRKSPEGLPMAIDIRPRFWYAEPQHYDMPCRETHGEGRRGLLPGRRSGR